MSDYPQISAWLAGVLLLDGKQDVKSDSDFRDEFLMGAARAFFHSAFAEYCEAHLRGEEGCELECEWELAKYALPVPPCADCVGLPIPPNAYAMAGELWGGLYALNGKAGPYSLALAAEAADGKPVNAEEFGHYLAMAAMGHGVSWFDNHADFPVEVPSIECHALTFAPSAYSR